MSNPVTVLETALYGTLSADADLITEIGGTAVYNQLAPQSPPEKYVIYQHQGGGDENETPHRTRNVIYAVFGVGLTQADAAGIDDKIDAALHGQTLTVTGYTNFWTYREGDIVFTEVDAGGTPRHRVGATYRIRLDDN